MISLGNVRKFVIGVALVAAPAASFASVFVSINIAPPELPIYAQPYCPGEGYLWTPGYWAYGEDGYFWVPGVWVQPPTIGYLWTPAYWGFNDGGYRFYPGYWGPHVGFYGGVNYGFGYIGQGYEGGYWRGNQFNYNRTVNNINVNNIHNTYVSNVTTVNNYNRVSYNGGTGGVQARPQGVEMQAQRDQHVQATPVQQQHQQLAAQNRLQLASVNNGRPQIAAARTPQDFRQNVVNARPADPQQRTVQAVRSGQVTLGQPASGQTHTPQPGAQSLPNQVRTDRQPNVTVLTPQERQDLNQRQNNVNRSVYNNGQNNRQNVDPRGLPRQQNSAQAPQQQVRPQQQPLMQARPQQQPMQQQRAMPQESRPHMQSPQPRPQMQEQRGGGGQVPGGGYQRR